jgi:hypothetical protein
MVVTLDKVLPFRNDDCLYKLACDGSVCHKDVDAAVKFVNSGAYDYKWQNWDVGTQAARASQLNSKVKSNDIKCAAIDETSVLYSSSIKGPENEHLSSKPMMEAEHLIRSPNQVLTDMETVYDDIFDNNGSGDNQALRRQSEYTHEMSNIENPQYEFLNGTTNFSCEVKRLIKHSVQNNVAMKPRKLLFYFSALPYPCLDRPS